MYKVILVDDEYMVLQGLEKIINWTELGFEVVGSFEDGQQALDYLMDHEVDLVVTDVTMPVLNGLDFIAKAQEACLDFLFIIISGYKDFNYALEGLRMGAVNYLIKPIDREELEKNVRQVLVRIHDEEKLKQSSTTYYIHTLRQWVTNDIDAITLKKHLIDFDYHVEDGLFTVTVIEPLSDTCEDVIDTLNSFEQPFHYVDEDDMIIAILDHKKDNLDRLVKVLVRNQGTRFRVGMGETVNQLEHVTLSYEHAMNAIELLDFYDIDLNKSLYDKDQATISLKEFNNALAQRDIKTIDASIEAVFSELERQQATPQYVRHITFMMLMDCRRAFEVSSDSCYDKTMKDISNAQTSLDLLHLLKKSLNTMRQSLKGSLYNPNVQKVIKIIMKQYDQDLSLKSISETLHLNTMYLGQLIKRDTGKSFSQYLNQYRIRQAQKLLLSTDLNINEISDAVGYSNSGYFYKNFKLICGVSPKEFKNRFVNEYVPYDDSI